MARARTSAIHSTNAGVKMEFSPSRRAQDNIRHMRAAFMNNVERVGAVIAAQMEDYAKQNYPWKAQSEDIHKPPRYPNDNADVQLQAMSWRVSPDVVGIVLQHSPDTIMVTASGRVVTYGGILEANYHGDTAIVEPTFLRFQEHLRQAIEGIDPFSGARITSEGPRTRR